jgi:hypothetical protein
MDDRSKSKEELIKELSDLRQENSLLKSMVSESGKRSSVISELEKAEDSLRDYEEKYRIISSPTADYIFRLSVEDDGTIMTDTISDNYFSLTKKTIKDISTPDLWLKIINEDDRPKLIDSMNLLISEGGSVDLECRSYLPDGKCVLCVLSLMP